MSSRDLQKRRWTGRLAVLSTIAALPSLFTANPALTFAGLALVPLLFGLLWRTGEPPVLLFAAMFQWLQVFMPVVNADWQNHVLGTAFVIRVGGLDIPAVPELKLAAWLGLMAILMLAIGMRIGFGSRAIADPNRLHGAAIQLSPQRLAFAYGVMFVFSIALERTAGVFPGLRQPLLALATLRWAAVFLIGWIAIREKQYRGLGIVVLTLEIIVGFLGSFSGFKTVLFVAFLVVLSGRMAFRRVGPVLVLIVGITVLLATFWQAVKTDYRVLIGEQGESIDHPISSRIAFLSDRAVQLRAPDFVDAFQLGMQRLGYLDFFAYALRWVPAYVPHQRGALWLGAVRHIFTPRLFFPNKPSIDDSERTVEFTGAHIAGAQEGTSISIGYVGESYIDFGFIGMFAPIFLLGTFWGWAYRWLATRTRWRLLGIAVATNLILGGALYFESSNIKLLGGAVSALIILWAVLRFRGEAIWGALVRPDAAPPPLAVAPVISPQVP